MSGDSYRGHSGGRKFLCYGFGKREHRCLNDAGSTHSQIFCQECDDARRAHITKQLSKIEVRFKEAERDL